MYYDVYVISTFNFGNIHFTLLNMIVYLEELNPILFKVILDVLG